MMEFQGVPPGVCRRAGGGVESRLLAGMVRGESGMRLAELGSGCGEAAIRVALANPGVLVDALELQEVLHRAACGMALSHGVAERVRMVSGDVRAPPAWMGRGGYGQVFCNPPFFLPEEGRVPPDPVRAAARFELTASLADFCRCAARLLAQGGEFHLVHRPERLVEIFSTLLACGLSPFHLIPVRDQPGGGAVLVLVSARKGVEGSGLTLGPERLTGGV